MENTDRHLLFAVLAFQNEYLNLAQLSAACRAWSADKSRSMSSVLQEKGWIDAAAQSELERLVERKLRRYGGDPRVTLGAVADVTERNAMRDVDDAMVTQTLSHLRAPSHAVSYPSHVTRETMVRPIENRSRYTLTQIAGEGGLGRIWYATDCDLNRHVALKELQPQQAVHPEALKRFIREAQVTGQLEHPNIVPVYELGHRPEDEQPFYTMRFIRGQTFKDAIADYHHRKRDKQDEPLEFQRLLNAYVSICHAMGYAHSRAVIHRDLKPENVILGPFGEVIVLDWGLAKIIDQREEDADEDTVTVSLTEIAQTNQTMRGRVMGTPAYMAPEQAEGRLDHIDPRTDIYGLGAVLFELLTGRVPHQGKTVPDLLRVIVTGSIPKPREIDPSIPKPLDAICAKCMAHKRADRYQDAQDVAQDVMRWLADEPVSVLRDPWTQRLMRWVRKNRARALAAVVSLLVITGVSVAASVLINQARLEEQQAKDAANVALDAEQKAKAQATQRLREAREVVDLFLGAVGEELSYHPVMEPARARLFERAAAEYERFSKQESDDRELQSESARAFYRLGVLRTRLGQLEAALEAFSKAENNFRKLANEPAAPLEFTLRIADSRTNAGFALARLGQKPEAEQHYLDAVAILDPLLEAQSDNAELGASLAQALTNLARLQVERGKSAEAEQTLVRATEVLKLLVEKTPNAPHLRAALAAAESQHGELLMNTGRHPEAAANFRSGILTLDRLVEEYPDEPDYFARRASDYVRLALSYHATGHLRLELESYRQAIDDFEQLVRVRPDVPVYRENYAVTQLDYGQALRQAGRNEDALPWIEGALSEYFMLSSTGAGAMEPRYIEGLGTCRSTLAHTLSDLGRQEEADSYVKAALIDFGDMVAAFPDEPRYREGRAIAKSVEARILARQGELRVASESYPQVADELRLLIQSEDLPQYHESLAEAYANLGRIELAQEKTDAAMLAFRQARDEWELLVGRYPESMRYQNQLAWLLATSPVEALQDLPRAIELAEQATRNAPSSPAFWRTLGVAQHFAGEYRASAVSLASCLQLLESDDGITLLVQAMNQFRQDDPEVAQETFQKAVEWIARQHPADEQAAQFRRAAEDVLGIRNDKS